MVCDKRVSIITPSFNRSDVVHETAASIFAQTYTNWEWIIVDDGSTDNSMEILHAYAAKDARVKVLTRTRNPKGAATCRNIAIEQSTGDYLIFLDTDDILASFCIEQRVGVAAQHPENDFTIFPMLMFKKEPTDTGLLWNIDNDIDDTLRVIYGDPVCQGTGTLWKKRSFVDIGMWDDTLALWQDIDLHLRAMLMDLKFTKHLNLQPDVFIRLSDESLSRTGFYSSVKIKSRMKVFVRALELARSKNKIAMYRDGFRNMGKNIYLSVIYSSFITKHEVNEMHTILRNFKLFSTKELRLFRWYNLAYKMKLYKLNILHKKLINDLNNVAPAMPVSLNKIQYTQPINL